MTEDWRPTDDQKNGVITRTVQFVSEEVQELIEELGCPKSYGASLLRAIAEKIEDKDKRVTKNSAYASRHCSTPEHEKAAESIVIENEKKAREAMKTEKSK